ncbi:hypothetical protein [uncultured Pontibacter sp.]|uniref:hypothetical protein n=1 Tax=uncultured Pontibacter sp. TaxID=453356 RepID=UPI00260BE164|nr:hypothetical protein [uncultured Pontibacter sp.]
MRGSTIAIAGFAGFVLYMVTSSASRAKNAVADLKVFVTKPEMPSVGGAMVNFPVQVRLYNYHDVDLPIETLKVTADYEDGGNWVEFATNRPNLNNWIVRRSSETKITVDMTSSIMNMLTDLYTIISSGGFKRRIRINVTPTVLGLRAEPIRQIFDM